MINKGDAYMNTLNTMQIVPMIKDLALCVCSKVNDKLVTAANNTKIPTSNPTIFIFQSIKKKFKVETYVSA